MSAMRIGAFDPYPTANRIRWDLEVGRCLVNGVRESAIRASLRGAAPSGPGAMRPARGVSSKNDPQAFRSAEAPFRHRPPNDPFAHMILGRPSEPPSRSRHREARAVGSFFRA